MRIETIIKQAMTRVLVGGTILAFPGFSSMQTEAANEIKTIKLPPPIVKGKISLEEAIKKRRSERDFQDRALSLRQVSQILWAAQGITEERGFKRAAPSAGALYPLELYLVVKKVEELEAGVYHYHPDNHTLYLMLRGNYQLALAKACLGQMFIADAPVSVVIAAEYERTTAKYGERGLRYVHIEVGHVGENICLQVVVLGLGTVPIGAFWDEEVSRLLSLPKNYKPLYVLPVRYVK
jgi:SagB-type dehydrogenase family enzyme